MLCLPPEDWILGSMCCDGYHHGDLYTSDRGDESPHSSRGIPSRCTRMYGWIHRSTWTARGVESSVDAPTYTQTMLLSLEYSYSWHHHPQDTRRVDPWIHDVVHRMSGPRHHSKSTGPEMLLSIMRSTALCGV